MVHNRMCRVGWFNVRLCRNNQQMSRRAERTRELTDLMTVEPDDDGTSRLILGGEVVGRLTQIEAGLWRCEWATERGWGPTPTQLCSEHREHAETWAVEEVATLIAVAGAGAQGGGERLRSAETAAQSCRHAPRRRRSAPTALPPRLVNKRQGKPWLAFARPGPVQVFAACRG
jgi:hypothetical protein